jgi:hypothetical protein
MLSILKPTFGSPVIRNLNAMVGVSRNMLRLIDSVKFRVEMAIPFLDKDHDQVDRTAIENVVKEVRDKCGGHNMVEAIGTWISPTGTVFTENLFLLRTDTDYANVVWLRDKAKNDWQTSLNQEEMFVTVSITFWIS